MKTVKERDLKQAIAKLTDIPVQEIGKFVLVFDGKDGSHMFHNMCCQRHATNAAVEVMAQPSIDLTEGNLN